MTDRIAIIECFCLEGSQASDQWGPAYGFLVKVTTTDGIVGFGESDTMPTIAAAAIEAAAINPMVTGLREVLVGTAAEPQTAWRRMRHAVIQYGRDGVVMHAMAAIDIALWDIVGKRAKQPTAVLLGGIQHDRLRCYGTHPLGSLPAESASHARRLVEQGFTAVKFGWPPLGAEAHTDEAIVAALRKAIGPSVDLLIDGGMAWDVPVALARLELLHPHRLFWLEEPLEAYDVAAYSDLRKASNTPIVAGEMAANGSELKQLVAAGGVDILQIDVSRTGLTQAIEIANYANSREVAVVNHTYGHLINAAASAHLLAAAQVISLYECQTAANEIRDALGQGQLQPRSGWLDLPTGPGLGVDIDEAVLRHFSKGQR